MRDLLTINAICWMIQNRQQVAAIPNTCGGEANLRAAIQRACVDGQVAFDEEVLCRLPPEDRLQHTPDWDALTEIVKVMCATEKSCVSHRVSLWR